MSQIIVVGKEMLRISPRNTSHINILTTAGAAGWRAILVPRRARLKICK